MHVEIERRAAARTNLPETRDARFHVKPAELVKFVMVDLIHRMGTRSNQAHLPVQYVPELRQFVEAVAADHTADSRDSGVIIEFEDRPLPLVVGAQFLLQVFGVGHHGAKLVATEAAAFGSGAFRGVDDRTR